jgi:hypothetical protein
MHTAQEGVASTTRHHSAIMNLTPLEELPLLGRC